MQGEFEYYSAQSGLTPPSAFSLADHKQAFWGGSGSLADREIAFLRAAIPASSAASLPDLRWRYFSPRSGLAPAAAFTIDDHRKAFFAFASQPLTGIVATADKPWPSTQPIGTVVTVSCTYTGWPSPEVLTLHRRVNGGTVEQLSSIPASSGHGGQFPAVTLDGVVDDVIDFEVRGNGGSVRSNLLTYTLA